MGAERLGGRSRSGAAAVVAADSITTLRGVGPATATKLAQLNIRTCGDLLWHLPTRHEDRRQALALADIVGHGGAEATTGVAVVEVVAHHFVPTGRATAGRSPRARGRGRGTLQLRVSDGTDQALLWCYGRGYLRTGAPVRTRLLLYARFKARAAGGADGAVAEASEFELHPLRSGAGPESVAWYGRIVPVYPLTKGVTQQMLRRLTLQLPTQASRAAAAARQPDEAEEAPGRFLSAHEALLAMHWPDGFERLALARDSVAFAELTQLQRALVKRQPPPRPIRALAFSRRQAVIDALPFSLTSGQRDALREIDRDLAAPVASDRLLQGDVGCGKTLVALLAACAVVEAGEQVALVVPTELLARQHAATAQWVVAPARVNVACLVGGSGAGTGVARQQRLHLLAALARGDIDLVVGTQALLREDVAFHRLGLVVVDEQHRFGVAQRRQLRAKGMAADLLLMSATPIPRSLALTVYGDLQLSTIRELPAGRRPVRTHLARMDRLDEVFGRVAAELDNGGQAYLVAPRIGEPEVAAADDSHAPAAHLDVHALANRVSRSPLARFPSGLVHGGLDDEQKSRVMEQFRDGEVRVLLATTVVEVGVDIPAATCLVVLSAERFGLATLHQLRGRVGRGAAQAYAFLTYDPALTPGGVARLRAMKQAADGFEIAELDLAQRGPGELLGLRQAGFPELRVADLTGDIELARLARERVHADNRR